ncbi:hypothetical protein D1007_55191 [Hordeum vulgare]|nr:hypothetical protein D1007_55191 [Hordeum vulgare]
MPGRCLRRAAPVPGCGCARSRPPLPWPRCPPWSWSRQTLVAQDHARPHHARDVPRRTPPHHQPPTGHRPETERVDPVGDPDHEPAGRPEPGREAGTVPARACTAPPPALRPRHGRFVGVRARSKPWSASSVHARPSPRQAVPVPVRAKPWSAPPCLLCGSSLEENEGARGSSSPHFPNLLPASVIHHGVGVARDPPLQGLAPPRRRLPLPPPARRRGEPPPGRAGPVPRCGALGGGEAIRDEARLRAPQPLMAQRTAPILVTAQSAAPSGARTNDARV